ncbi:hypothetical protein DOTSEDRAFT_20553 [Dothistroma septosporum NZE10]|uniref:Uncharacterized protein n=1 Tax=Dothistroma septosporum (strain NZE10 / CBS 128990) TaxID=675120 RepID=N1Q3A9_DOTSN|nr:hypothetical protein DOTSEDRAFT_20553 [Dothistroma septosporum NZE10]
MLSDLGAMEECSELTWCGSAIWSWISFAAQQAVTRSNIAEDEIAGRVIDDVTLAEHALEGSSRSGLYMMQKTYKLVTGMRRLPEYGDVDWEEILPREMAATESINEQLRVLEQGPVVERADVMKAVKTAKLEPPEPLPTPQSDLNPWDPGYASSSKMRNLLLGLDDSPAESLRSLSEGPPEDPYPYPGGPGSSPPNPPGPPGDPSPPSDPSPSNGPPSNPEPPNSLNQPGSPKPPNSPSPPSDPDPPGDPSSPTGSSEPPVSPRRPSPVGIDPVRISRITKVLHRLGSKFKNVLQSIKDMFRKVFDKPGKARPRPDVNERPPTRNPLKPQPGTQQASRPPPRLQSVPRQTNPDDPLDDFQRGNPRAQGFNSANQPPAPKPISINRPSRGLQINDGFGQRRLKPNEPLFQETFDSGKGNLAPHNVKSKAHEDRSWDEGTIEAANLDFLQSMGLMETLPDADIAGEDTDMFVMSSQALRPTSLDKGKAKASLIEDAADNCALSRRRDCKPLSAPGGMVSLTMEAAGGSANPIFDTLGQPLISTVGTDGLQQMLGVRPGSDGVYCILKNTGGIAHEAGRLTFEAANGAYRWLPPYNHTGQPDKPAPTRTPASTFMTSARPTKPTPTASTSGQGPIISPTHGPSPPHQAPLSCDWTHHDLQDYEVWSDPTLPPGCSQPTFYECTPYWDTYTACNFPQNAKACKKLRKHNPASQCPKSISSSLSPQYLNWLGPKTMQTDCTWSRTLQSGMVWSNANMAPGCTRPTPWECTKEWEHWFYNGTDVERVRPNYCWAKEPGENSMGHDLAMRDMGCGWDFGGKGCSEKFLRVVV